MVTDIAAPPEAVPRTDVPARWNALSIVAFVTAIVGLSVVGVVCGHIGVAQTRRSGEQGAGLAIAGLVIGYIGVALWFLFWVVAIVSWGYFAAASPTSH